MLKQLEDTMYQLSDFFLAPVLILLLLAFAYALYSFGSFAFQAWQRYRYRRHFVLAVNTRLGSMISGPLQGGYPLVDLAHRRPAINKDQLDVAALEELDGVRMVSRLAPMLGLIATMIPMGPALKSLADGNVQGISENLVIAFSAVIFGLVTASITFWIASIKKRWLAAELVALMPLLGTDNAIRESASITEIREVTREAAG
jgi:hypothetical protein